MPISGLTNAPKAFMRLGLIKKGERRKMKKVKDGQEYEIEVPVDLDYFRMVFSPGALAGEIEASFRREYGERPQSLNVRFADPTVKEVWDANYECHKQGALIAKAGTTESGPFWIFYRDPDTAEVLVRNGAPVGDAGREFIEKPIDLETPIYHMRNGEPAFLEPVGRLQVVIPEVSHIAVGYFEFQPGSPRDIRNISAELAMYAAMASNYGQSITGIPFVLGRRAEQVTRNVSGKLSKTESFPVHLTAGGIWGRQAIDMIERLALPEFVDVVPEDVTPPPSEDRILEHWQEDPAAMDPGAAAEPATDTDAPSMTYDEAKVVTVTTTAGNEKFMSELNDKQLKRVSENAPEALQRTAAAVVLDERKKEKAGAG